MHKQAPVIIGGAALAIVCFAGGVFVGSHRNVAGFDDRSPTAFRDVQGGNFRNGTDGNVRGGMMGNRFGGGVVGQVDHVDGSTLYIKQADGSLKPITLSDATTITKTVSGTKTDLTSGETVMISGAPGTDNVYAAKTIQVRPAQPAAPTTPKVQ